MAFRPHSHVEQVAEHLRGLLRQGRWTELLPGAKKLEEELSASHTIIDRALRLLEHEGLVINQGPGRRRRIKSTRAKPTKLRVRILRHDDEDAHLHLLMDQIHQAGHEAGFAERSLVELGMKRGRVAQLVNNTKADAWIVIAGPRHLLEWFVDQPMHAFALYGGIRDVPIASCAPRKMPAFNTLLERLLELGHRRIVHIVREQRRKPVVGAVEQFFLNKLEEHKIPTGPYNLPDWGDSPQDLQRMLDSLFEHTPPSALIVDEPTTFLAVRDHLARKGICAPDQISMACLDGMHAFHWHLPEITHISWDPHKAVRQVIRWVNQVAKGSPHRRMSLVDSQLIEGGTIGPAPH